MNCLLHESSEKTFTSNVKQQQQQQQQALFAWLILDSLIS